MAIEIRELLIKVKIDEPLNNSSDELAFQKMKQSILKECKKEIRKQLRKNKDR
ncbi:DUF5908 family protein [Pukyongia salina]|mgnify:CR=1 FL=1|uniref:DUF5908 family protein n=1 Tax=Pukyongia salina TaxID=2094025 RepID=UPI00131A4652|nr:DUF5908 family protein [Pukyongia salina]